MAAAKKTNAVRILEGLKIPFELLEYEIDEKELSAEDAAAKTGIAEERTFKTLCCRGDKTGVIMVCVPAGRELDFKALAAASGNKSTELVHLKEVQGADRLRARRLFTARREENIPSSLTNPHLPSTL